MTQDWIIWGIAAASFAGGLYLLIKSCLAKQKKCRVTKTNAQHWVCCKAGWTLEQ